MEVYWLEQTGADVPPGDEWLSAGERTALEWLHIPKRRADWLLGRWTAKRAIAPCLRLDQDCEALAAIEVRAASTGAPAAFIGGRRAGVSISLSHSHGAAFCAVAAAGTALGCDVEKVDRHSQTFIDDYFTAEEQEAVPRSPAHQRDRVVTLLWSAKESALKALQCGLRADTRSVNARPAELLPWQDETWHPLTAHDIMGRIFHGWWRETGDLVWTLVAIPAPTELIALAGSSFMKDQLARTAG
jgi:4'-phosphopantetheinyl transferase